jgi:hypothetical protein
MMERAMRSLPAILAATLATFVLSPPAEAATISATASCESVYDDGGTTYDAFTACFVDKKTRSFGGETFDLNDHFEDKTNKAGVKTLVSLLFTDTTISSSGSFSPGDETGKEFEATRQDDDFSISSGGVGNDSKSVTISALPEGTIFVSLKNGNRYDLFGLDGLTVPLTFGTPKGISHISTFSEGGGITPNPDPDITPVPLPAAGFLLIGGLGGLVALRRRRSRSL